MVAVAKNEPYVGFTPKAVIGTLIQESTTLVAITKALEKSFPRKFGKPAQKKRIPKLVSRLLRALHRGNLTFDKIETVHVPAPKEAIKVKDVEFKLPKAYTKPKKEPKAAKEVKGKTKKATKRVSVSDDGDVEEVS